MSPRSDSASGPAAASRWLLEKIEPIASEVTERLFSKDSELTRKYGPRGMIKCRGDTEYHLLYLSEAVAASSITFEHYVAWAKVMLQSRGVGTSDLLKNLEEIAEVIGSHAPRSFKRLLLEPVRSAIAALPVMPEAVPSFIEPASSFAELANEYLGLLLVLKREDGYSLISRHLRSGLTIKNLVEYVVKPVQQEVGRLWQENRITVVQEHYCTAANDILLSQLRHQALRVQRSVTALAVCAEGEQHSLGLRIFADLLEADGWKVAYAGSNCPVSEVLKQISGNQPDLVAISSATLLSLGRARQLINSIRTSLGERAPAILFGGALVASNPDLCRSIQADACVSTASAGLEAASRLVRSSGKVGEGPKFL